MTSRGRARLTVEQAGDEAGKADRDGNVRVRVVPADLAVGGPGKAHEERDKARDEEEVANPVERLDLVQEGAVTDGARRRVVEEEEAAEEDAVHDQERAEDPPPAVDGVGGRSAAHADEGDDRGGGRDAAGPEGGDEFIFPRARGSAYSHIDDCLCVGTVDAREDLTGNGVHDARDAGRDAGERLPGDDSVDILGGHRHDGRDAEEGPCKDNAVTRATSRRSQRGFGGTGRAATAEEPTPSAVRRRPRSRP